MTAAFDGNVDPGQIFEMTIIVTNTGQVAAENAQLFLRADPAGDFRLMGALSPLAVCRLLAHESGVRFRLSRWHYRLASLFQFLGVF